MKNRIFTKLIRKVTILMILMMMLAVVITGCDELDELVQDYIQVNVIHELQAESYNNEQVYTYKIDATVTNNYLIDLPDAVIRLDIPDEVEIVEGKVETKEKISCGEENIYYYTWIVRIEPTTEDRNVDYSVSITSELITQVSAYESIFVEGKNENDNRLDFSVDTWSFKNYAVKPIPITQDDYDALLLDLNNTERQEIKNKISSGAGGQCYGMAITTILAKTDRIDLARLQGDASNLHDVSKNEEAKSTIAYYYLTQFLNPAKDKIAQYITMDNEQKLATLIELAENVKTGGTPVLFAFYMKNGGHAVVAYGCEKCSYTSNGKTYDNCILIYDNNYPEWDEDSYLYYNNEGEWIIPNYPTAETLGFITTTMEEIDISNIEQNRESVYTYITSRNNASIEITSEGNTWKIDGMETNGAEDIVAYYDIGSEDNTNLNIAIKKRATEAEYVIASQDTKDDLDISVNYDNYYMSANAEGDDQITLNPSGSVDIVGETSDFSMSITGNDGCNPLPWSTVTVSAKRGENPKLAVSESGYVLSGEDLKDITIYAENNDIASKLSVDTNEEQVLITQDGEKLCVMSDEDEDGEFETILVTGTTTTPGNPFDGFGSLSRFSLGTIDTWGILLIVGVFLVMTLLIVIVVVACSKKKENEEEIEVPVVNQEDVLESNDLHDNQKNNVIEELTEGICVLSGSMSGMQFEIAEGHISYIGKDANLVNIVLDNTYGMVSRIHCSITYSAKFDKYFVIDCSTNGTYFENGQRLSKNTRIPVTRGTVLKLANDDCRIKLI